MDHLNTLAAKIPKLCDILQTEEATKNALVKKLALPADHMIDYGFNTGPGYNRIKFIPLSEILVQHSAYTNITRLKIRLLREGFLEAKCYGRDCGLTDWHGKPLSLQLDHINGDNLDHRIENLRLLCPNCHSQTETFAGKNKRKQVPEEGFEPTRPCEQ
ncbi:MAG TPA: HNH endonuclease [Pyrinomonadaceae bacterium]|nr:HNH endonuclease [Pyrinomonadaceae bacterium]